MKRVILLYVIVTAAMPAYSQSMRIQMTDQSIVTVDLADVDSITFSVAAAAQTMNLWEWECLSLNSGLTKSAVSASVLEQTADGLKLISNNKMVYRSTLTNGSLAGRNIYLKWNASGESANMLIDLLNEAGSITYRHQLLDAGAGSTNLAGGAWYYTRIAVSGLTADVYTGIGGYDDNGGTTLWKKSVLLEQPAATLAVGCCGSMPAWITLAEARIE